MEAIIVSCQQEHVADILAKAFDQHHVGNVIRYHRGRRIAGGVRHVAESWLMRDYPECLLQPRVLLLLAESSDAQELLDEVLNLVVRQDNPNEIQVRLVALDNRKTRPSVGSSGN